MKKHLQYLKYLLKHKYYVFIAGLRFDVSVYRLIIHDWSKFLPCEWFPYVNYFYGEWTIRAEKLLSDNIIHCNFDGAWLHHQKYNKHHYQYWILVEDSGNIKYLDMPKNYAREMLADWAGAGRAITGKWEFKNWYYKNINNIKLSINTRIYIENLMKEIKL